MMIRYDEKQAFLSDCTDARACWAGPLLSEYEIMIFLIILRLIYRYLYIQCSSRHWSDPANALMRILLLVTFIPKAMKQANTQKQQETNKESLQQ